MAAAHSAILQAIVEGMPWSEAALSIFDGLGSMGNGGAMRVAPVGAYFAGELARVIEEARASAIPTHAHPDGQAGAIAVAVAASLASDARVRAPSSSKASTPPRPDGPTRDVLAPRAPAAAHRRCPHRRRPARQRRPRCAPATPCRSRSWCAARHPRSVRRGAMDHRVGLGDRDNQLRDRRRHRRALCRCGRHSRDLSGRPRAARVAPFRRLLRS